MKDKVNCNCKLLMGVKGVHFILPYFAQNIKELFELPN